MNYVSEALEQLFAARAFLGTCIQNADRRGSVPAAHRAAELSFWSDDYLLLQYAQPYYWSTKCVDLVLSQQDAFNLDEITTQRNLVTSDRK